MYEYVRKFVALKAIWNTLNYKKLFITFVPVFVSPLQLNIVYDL